MKVIAFTGMPFSGKSEAVHIAKKQGIPVVRMGDMVWEEVKKRNLPLNSETVGNIAHEMRIKKGMDIWARKTIEQIQKLPISSDVVVDGIRNIEEIDTFKASFGPDFILIAVISSDTIRHTRALSRNRVDDSGNLDEIKNRDQRENKWGIQEVINKADVTFKNEGTLDSFQQEITDYLHTFKL